MMRKLLIPILALFAISLCHPCFADDKLSEEERKKESPYVFEIQKMGGGGHGCAVNGLIITNRHMVDPRREWWEGDLPKMFFRYEWPDETAGVGHSVTVSAIADLAIVKLDKEPPNGYAPLATERPQEGDLVYWWEYDLRKQGDAFQPRYKEGKITTITAGHAILAKDVVQGASGGCAFNEYGEAIGLMSFGFGTTKDYKQNGGVTGFWGHWWRDLVNE
jgi:hypothetical protein